LDEDARPLLALMAARLASQGVSDRTTAREGDLCRTLAYAFLRCGIEGRRPESPDDILLPLPCDEDEVGRHAGWEPEDLENRGKLIDGLVAYHLTREDAEALVDCCLTWRPDVEETIPLPNLGSTNRDQSHPLREVNVILGFAFGNRFVVDREGRRNGNREAGPINERLADLVVEYYQAIQLLRHGLSPPEIWVQWEIADRIADRTPCRVICPEINREKDEVSYLSTSDVIEIVGPDRLREHQNILVAAHPDHLLRCMWIVSKGYDQYYQSNEHRLPYGVRYLPSTARDDEEAWYDPESGKFWTACRHRCLIHEAIGRLRIYQSDRFRQTADCLAEYRRNLHRKGGDQLVWQPKPKRQSQG
jgi:hypothetical protein